MKFPVIRCRPPALAIVVDSIAQMLRRPVFSKLIAGIAIVACFAGRSVKALGNSGDVFKTTATDLSVGTNYTTTITPTAATTTDVQLSGVYGTTTLTINGAALNFGTLNDLDATQSLVITNSATSTPGTITLNTAANSTVGSNASDLLYVASGANLTIQSGTGTSTTTLVLAAAGNIDNAGTLVISGPVSIANGDTITFTGNGATTISGAIAITTGSLVVNAGAGSVTLSGTIGYTGTTAISSGSTLKLGLASGTDTLTAAAGGGGFVGNLVVSTAIRVNFDNGVFSGGGQIQVQTTGAVLNNSSSAFGPGTVSNAISLNSTGIAFTKGNVAVTYAPGTFVTSLGGTTSTNSTSPITFSGIISGNSDLNFANNASTGGGGGAVVLGSSGIAGGAAGYETYAGTTTVNNNGVITFANSNVLPTGTDVIVGTQTGIGTPTFNLNGFNQQIGSLSDGANVTATAHNLTITNNAMAAPATLTIGDSITPATGTSAPIVDGSSTVALVKTGTDTITLKGSHNAFSGGVAVNQGTLTATGTGALGTGFVTVNPTGTSGTSADAATLNTSGSSIANGTALTVDSNSATAIGTVNFTTASPGIGSLTGNGSVVLQNATGTNLTVGFTNNLSSTFSGAISEATAGEGSITKAGTGVLALSGINAYTGATMITAGALVIDGSIARSSTTVQTGGALGGSGAVGSVNAQSGGTLAPGLEMSGETINTLTASGLTWNSGATLNFELSAVNNTSDELSLSLGTGVLTQGGSGLFQFNFLGGGEAGQTYDLINFESTTFANASAFSATDLAPGLSANFTLSSSQLEVLVQAVPEPSAWGALVWGVAVLIGFRRFRQGARAV
jgi:fibronectin-binding autotransporter adhesin